MRILPIISTLLFTSLITQSFAQKATVTDALPDVFIVVLGIAQDAGYPQIGCTKECCKAYWDNRADKKQVTSLALVDRKSNQYWLIEASPDINYQLHSLQAYLPSGSDYSPAGIFVTHAHTGHYTGLMEFGREAMGASRIPVWAMPRMRSFLRNNGPWDQLVSLNNIELRSLTADSAVNLSSTLRITPVRVPHRDEYSETVGFRIESSKKRILFIPDIDKWDKWDRHLTEEIKKCDVAFLDGTFFSNGELPGRDMKEIPHPFVTETMYLLGSLPLSERKKVEFIHFNHTNPLIRKENAATAEVKAKGMQVAEEGMIVEL